MKKIIIFGLGSFAELMSYYINRDNAYQICGYTVNKAYINVSEFLGLPVIPFEDIEKTHPASDFDLFLGIGYKNMNQDRKRVFLECKEKGYHIVSYLHPSALQNEPEIGEGNIIMDGGYCAPFVKIGNANIFWDNCKIGHDVQIGNFNTITGDVSLCGFVKVGNNCFLGNSSVVTERKHIADYTLVGSGAVVTKDTQPYAVVVPARSVVLDKNSEDMNL